MNTYIGQDTASTARQNTINWNTGQTNVMWGEIGLSFPFSLAKGPVCVYRWAPPSGTHTHSFIAGDCAGLGYAQPCAIPRNPAGEAYF